MGDPKKGAAQGAAAGSTMGPWGTLGGAAIGAIGAGLSGPGDPALGNLHLVNSAQQGLYNTMARKLLGGGGDFGFGSAFKQGKASLQGMMANQGISPQSGVALSAMGNMGAQAVNQDAQNRRNTWFQLMGQPLQVAQTAGANYIPGSPTVGSTTDVQARNYDKGSWRKRYRNWGSEEG